MTVVVAAQGYPGQPVTGDPIEGLAEAEQLAGAYVLQAGTAVADGVLRSAGGRVLNVVGTGPDVAGARAAAYAAAARIRLRGSWFRTDIAAESGFPAASPR